MGRKSIASTNEIVGFTKKLFKTKEPSDIELRCVTRAATGEKVIVYLHNERTHRSVEHNVKELETYVIKSRQKANKFTQVSLLEMSNV